MEMNPTVRKYENIKNKQNIQRISLFIVEYFADVRGFVFFYVKPKSEQC